MLNLTHIWDIVNCLFCNDSMKLYHLTEEKELVTIYASAERSDK